MFGLSFHCGSAPFKDFRKQTSERPARLTSYTEATSPQIDSFYKGKPIEHHALAASRS